MKQFLKKIFRPFVWLAVTLIYLLGSICYDKKYLTGRYFNRWHFTVGWSWILQCWFPQKVLGRNGHVPWPVPLCTCVSTPENIEFDPDDMDNFFTTGSYFQGIGAKIRIGKGCQISNGVGLVTANHDLLDITKSAEGKDIILGPDCVVGMNAVILPGVVLGPHTIVGAGSIVTKSFPEGWCVIAGNPAKKLRDIPSVET